jgi:hypothetical protein
MSSKIESGMNTYVGHFQLLIDVCAGFGTVYNPQVPALTIKALSTQLANVQTSINNVDLLMALYLVAEGTRRNKFAIVPPLSVRVQAAAIVLGLPDAILVHVKEVVRKIYGKRAKKLKPEDKVNADGVAVKHISVSQTSFNEQIEHFNQLIDLVASQSSYTPAENDLTVASLKTLLAEMREANEAVMRAVVPVTAARQERDRLIFEPKTGMIDTALTIKKYVKALFGTNSQQYKEVNHIKFKNKSL